MTALWNSLQPKDILTLTVSAGSFLLAGYALWVAQFNHGQLRMTQPALLCLKRELSERIPKIFFRSLLFCAFINLTGRSSLAFGDIRKMAS